MLRFLATSPEEGPGCLSDETYSALVEWFRASAKAAGYRLDMGKSCIRFKRLEDVPLELLAEALQRMPLEGFLARYTAAIPASSRSKKRPR